MKRKMFGRYIIAPTPPETKAAKEDFIKNSLQRLLGACYFDLIKPDWNTMKIAFHEHEPGGMSVAITFESEDYPIPEVSK